ncbi:hypothetical protein HRbin08_00458 [bacterium HR08]|nr:hypothetical protein HRbin08_00458 [bacterium HR08]
MPRERRLDGDLRRLRIANLADHDLVRVMPQDRAQAPGEGEPFLLVDLDLRHAFQLILHRVLDGDDLLLPRSDLIDGRIERRRLARAGGSGDEDHPIRLADEMPEFSQRLGVESEHIQAQVAEFLAELLLVEDADDGIFAVNGRYDRDAEINGAPAHAHAEPAILRDAPLSDVQFRHHLDARDDRLMMLNVNGRSRRVEHTVNAVFDHDLRSMRLNVNIAGAPLQGRQDDRIHKLHNRAHLPIAHQAIQVQVLLPLLGLLHERHAQMLGRLIQDALRGIAAREHRFDRRGGRHHPAHLLPQPRANLIQTFQIRGIGDGHKQHVPLPSNGDEAILHHQLDREKSQQFLIQAHAREIEKRQPIPFGQAARALLFDQRIRDRRGGRPVLRAQGLKIGVRVLAHRSPPLLISPPRSR